MRRLLQISNKIGPTEREEESIQPLEDKIMIHFWGLTSFFSEVFIPSEAHHFTKRVNPVRVLGPCR